MKRADTMKSVAKAVSQVNWKKVNEESGKTFLVAIVGDVLTFESFEEMLAWSSYDFMGIKRSRHMPLSPEARAMVAQVPIGRIDGSRPLLERADLVFVDRDYVEEARGYLKRFYVYREEAPGTALGKAMQDHEAIKQALCYNFPACRSQAARSLVSAVAMQNAAWAGGTALPNIVPGMHILLGAPIEATSDFFALTVNELRMTFLLAGISGKQVDPLRMVPELGIMLGGAKSAQMLATQVLGKVPAGAGAALKAAIAFAFTFAIGEAVYLYMNYGIPIDSGKIKERMEELMDYAKSRTAKLAGKGRKRDA